MEEQLLDREFKRCENLEGINMQNCALKLIAKYRNSEALKEELLSINLDLTTVFGASVYAVQEQSLRKCKLIRDQE
jgi:hypothetical protein